MLQAQGPRAVIPQVSLVTSVLNGGGIIGCLCFPFIADHLGRKPALTIYFMGAALAVPITFSFVEDYSVAVLVSPLVGFFGAGVFTGFAIYLPELFPTAIRATAQGFCYNFARFFSAAAPFIAGAMVSAHGSFGRAITMIGLVYLLSLIVVIFARETKGQALPE
jgi:MFS family permease